MPYLPLATLTTLPPKVTRVVWKLERHYFRPVHAMFRLPIPNYRVTGEFAFSMVQVLLSGVAGLSTTVYAPAGSKGERFRNLLVDCYPFSFEPPNALVGIKAGRALWNVFRNPLTHDLGFDLEKHAKAPEAKLLRRLTNNQSRGLSEAMIESLEDPSKRPTTKATVAIENGATVLSIDALYWGIRILAERLLADSARVSAAEASLP